MCIRDSRAIIRVPDSGDIYHLLWVDNHDEAMDWAANKLFEWNSNTQSYQVFTAPDAIVEEPTKTIQKEHIPSTKKILDAYSDKQLTQIGVPPVLLPSVRTMNSLDELEAMESYLPAEAFENLFFLFDGVDITVSYTHLTLPTTPYV